MILCTKTFGSIEILKSKEFAFFFKDLSPESIKEKILEIYHLWINNPEKFRKLKQAAKEYAFHNFSFSKELQMFKILIDNIGKI